MPGIPNDGNEYAFYTENRNIQHPTDWQSTSDSVRKQIAYIIIINKQRNWITQVEEKGTSNLKRNYE